LNNFNNYLDIDKINSQLERADKQKRILIRNIYREYEIYLKFVRDLLYISVEKGINQIYSYPTIDDNFLNENKFCGFFEKKISKLIYSNMPLLTVEQLKINEIEKNINKEINFNSFDSYTKRKDYQKEKFQYEDGFQLEEPIQFEISKDISNTSEYYQVDSYEKLVSLELDNNDQNNYLSNNNIIENSEDDKIKPLVGELPQDKLNKYLDNYSLDKDIAKIIIAEKQNANLFEKMISESTVKPKFIAAWLVGDIFAFIKENNLEVNSLNDKTKDITDLLRLISDDVISNKAGKEILPKVLNGEGKPSELVKELGLEQVSDSGELEKIIDEALVGEEENILKFQGGSDRVLGYFVGKCLKATKGKGNPKLINKILLERLKK